MTCFTILLGGQLSVTTRLKQQVAESRFIAADGGIRHAKALGITPELWLGDFDSSDEDLFQHYRHVGRMKYPVAKDATDGELAIEEALKRGASKIILCGAFGGTRTDHGLLHMTHAVALVQRGVTIFLTSGNEEGWPLHVGRESYDFPEDTLFSIVGFSDLVGLSLSGVKWPLDDKDVPFGSSLTLSNKTNGTIQLSLRSGKGILLASLS